MFNERIELIELKPIADATRELYQLMETLKEDRWELWELKPTQKTDAEIAYEVHFYRYESGDPNVDDTVYA